MQLLGFRQASVRADFGDRRTTLCGSREQEIAVAARRLPSAHSHAPQQRAIATKIMATTKGSLLDVAKEFASLGVVAFGGPPAHVAMMLDRLVHGLGWIDEASFTSLFALTQALPGPSSTQLATALGGLRAGVPGAVVAFCCFDARLPRDGGRRLLARRARAIERPEWAERLLASAQIGLAAAAVALVAKAVITLGTKCAPDKLTRVLATGGAVGAMLLPGSGWLFPALLAAGGAVTVAAQAASKPPLSAQDSARTALSRAESGVPKAAPPAVPVSRNLGGALFALWLVLLLALGASARAGGDDGPWVFSLADSFYRTGSLIWGGGQARSDHTAARRAAPAAPARVRRRIPTPPQVVLPMLLAEVVPKWASEATFIQGFALVQALPGPMFNFSAFLGGVARGPMGALVAWASLFGPGLLLIIAALPYWAEVQGSARAKAVLRGVNAVACGLVVAAAFLLAQHDAATLPQQAIAVVCFSAAQLVGVHPALVVVLGAAIGPPLCAAVDCSA